MVPIGFKFGSVGKVYCEEEEESGGVPISETEFYQMPFETLRLAALMSFCCIVECIFWGSRD